ncbi:hypothetical protein BKA83DRAFT_4128626 [Pisolithus microcarpus]|nr:hypothetical protein BKA83DRAFT_4128626 [Pisolithus microcarpus]
MQPQEWKGGLLVVSVICARLQRTVFRQQTADAMKEQHHLARHSELDAEAMQCQLRATQWFRLGHSSSAGETRQLICAHSHHITMHSRHGGGSSGRQRPGGGGTGKWQRYDVDYKCKYIYDEEKAEYKTNSEQRV